MTFAENFPELKTRISRITGGDYVGEAWVVELSIHSNIILVSIAVRYDEQNIPQNFKKKNRDLLRFDLSFEPLSMNVTKLADTSKKGEITVLTEQELKIRFGDFSYSFLSEKTNFHGFNAGNFYDTMLDNWSIDTDGYSL